MGGALGQQHAGRRARARRHQHGGRAPAAVGQPAQHRRQPAAAAMAAQRRVAGARRSRGKPRAQPRSACLGVAAVDQSSPRGISPSEKNQPRLHTPSIAARRPLLRLGQRHQFVIDGAVDARLDRQPPGAAPHQHVGRRLAGQQVVGHADRMLRPGGDDLVHIGAEGQHLVAPAARSSPVRPRGMARPPPRCGRARPGFPARSCRRSSRRSTLANRQTSSFRSIGLPRYSQVPSRRMRNGRSPHSTGGAVRGAGALSLRQAGSADGRVRRDGRCRPARLHRGVIHRCVSAPISGSANRLRPI